MKKIILILLVVFTSCSTLNEREYYESNLKILKEAYPKHKIKGYRNFAYIFTITKGKDTIAVSVSRSAFAMPVIDTLAIKIYKYIDN